MRLRLLLQLLNDLTLDGDGLLQRFDLLILLGLLLLHLGLQPSDLDLSLIDLLTVLSLSDDLLLEVVDLLPLILRGNG